MTVKELIQRLQSFDVEHPVVIQSDDRRSWNIGTDIVDVVFNGCCIIVIESED